LRDSQSCLNMMILWVWTVSPVWVGFVNCIRCAADVLLVWRGRSAVTAMSSIIELRCWRPPGAQMELYTSVVNVGAALDTNLMLKNCRGVPGGHTGFVLLCGPVTREIASAPVSR
jgi:hypothetical protein